MATTPSFTAYVCEALAGTGSVRSKKMFGEYLVYVDDKPMLLVCDNTVYVKKHAALSELLCDAPTGIPYAGAKEHFIADPDDAVLLKEIIARLLPVTLVPKPKSKPKKIKNAKS